jgi:hypothetical protein
MKLQISMHANDKMIIDGISKEMVKTAIKRGAISRQTDGYLAVYSYICVAYKRIGELYRIKTVFVKK